MASFEETSGVGLSGEQNRQGSIEIPIPEEPDESWCSMLAAAYGNGTYRTTIKTASYLRQKFPAYGNRHKRYENFSCETPNGKLGKIDGLLLGVKMIPEFDDGGSYIPHVVLVYAEQEFVPFWIADHPDQEFVVPINDTGEQLVLYPDS